MKPKEVAPAPRSVRRNRMIRERVHDSYKLRRKRPEPTLCPGCGAVFREGRWQWAPAPNAARRETCPACNRIRDGFPAGFVTLDGAFLRSHRDELVQLVRNLEAREKAEHPLQRIIDIAEQNGALVVTTTDIHLARGIGEALHRAYRGELQFHYNEEESLLRVRWSR